MRACRAVPAWWPVIAILSFIIAGCGSGKPSNVKSSQRGNPTDIGGVAEKKEFKEVEVEFPGYPREPDLIKFQLRRNSSFLYYIDSKSISIGSDRVVRYSAVIKSSSGALNTTYEGLRCMTSEFKVYAYGAKSGEWTKAYDSQWRKIDRASIDFRFTLYKDYFCDIEAVAGRNEKDLIANLKGDRFNNVTDKGR